MYCFLLFQILFKNYFIWSSSYESMFALGLVISAIMSIIPYLYSRYNITISLNNSSTDLFRSSWDLFVLHLYFCFLPTQIIYFLVFKEGFTSFFPHTNFFAWITSVSVIYYGVCTCENFAIRTPFVYSKRSIFSIGFLLASGYLLFQTSLSRGTILSLSLIPIIIVLFKVLTVKKNSYLFFLIPGLAGFSIFSCFRFGLLNIGQNFLDARSFDYSNLSGREFILNNMVADFVFQTPFLVHFHML